MREYAYAKINLCLDVIRKREDGYHDLKMIMVPLDFYDVLDIEFAPETTMKLNRSYLPVDNRNTVIKAIQLMKETYGIEENFACNLGKHIPSRAGLAGGSADGAAAIRAINKLKRLNLSRDELIALGKQVGADVPFCIFNTPALVEGIGDIIHPFACDLDCYILLVKPNKGVSTAAAFAGIDFENTVHPDCEKMRDCLISGDYEGVVSSLGNSLEEVSLKLVEEIDEVKQDLLSFGFDGVLMSGSGSTVFGITQSRRLGRRVNEIMRAKGYFVRTTRIFKGK